MLGKATVQKHHTIASPFSLVIPGGYPYKTGEMERERERERERVKEDHTFSVFKLENATILFFLFGCLLKIVLFFSGQKELGLFVFLLLHYQSNVWLVLSLDVQELQICCKREVSQSSPILFILFILLKYKTRSLLGFHGTTTTGDHQLAQQEAAKNEFLYTQKTGSMDRYKAAVIGAGPAGLAVVATLLDQECTPILWIDPNFEAGRLSNYMEVPSNTKVKLFQQYVTTSPSLNRFSSTALMPFVGQDPDKGCPLNLAATMVKSLTDSIRKADSTRVHCVQKVVKELAFSEGRWKIDGADECERVYLATGSHPRSFPDTGVKELLLDDVLTPTRIPELVTDDDTVGVIGSSHSAILALKNLLECATTRPKRIINFFQSPLLFAIYKEGWILYDNTGLKGEAADWAKQELQSGNLEKEKKLERICVKDYSPEEQVKSWQQCTKLVHAVGFDRNPVPKILFNGDELKQISYDPNTGKIADGLYGCGIAFPEKTVDPYGNQEYAVGLWKFMCYAQKKIKL